MRYLLFLRENKRKIDQKRRRKKKDQGISKASYNSDR